MNKEFVPTEQVAYIPTHAMGDVNHPDVEFGFVVSKAKAPHCYYVRYWSKYSPGELRTKANSEITPEENLIAHKSHTESQVNLQWEKYVTGG
jgi:hypothetical protein